MRLWLVILSIFATIAVVVWFKSSGVDDASGVVATRSDDVSVVKLPSSPSVGTSNAYPAKNNQGEKVDLASDAQDQKEITIPDDSFVISSQERKDFFQDKLYKQVRAEARDSNWASRSEQALRAEITAIPHIANGDALRANCAATICEIRGEFSKSATNEDIDRSMRDLQGQELRQRMKANGLK